jgi:CspA family cold shock protein
MASGTVRWFDQARGYGFIEPDDGGSDVFLHHRAIKAPVSDGFNSVVEGARVDYEARPGNRGPEAVWVTPVPA